MADHGRITEIRYGTTDQIALGWMEVPAGRIHAECPTCFTCALPGRYRQAVVEELRNAPQVHRHGRYLARNKGIVVQWLSSRQELLQRYQRRALIPTKRVRLGGPVQIPWASGIALGVMFSGLMIIENLLKWF
jgi:hypothetical protein